MELLEFKHTFDCYNEGQDFLKIFLNALQIINHIINSKIPRRKLELIYEFHNEMYEIYEKVYLKSGMEKNDILATFNTDLQISLYSFCLILSENKYIYVQCDLIEDFLDLKTLTVSDFAYFYSVFNSSLSNILINIIEENQSENNDICCHDISDFEL